VKLASYYPDSPVARDEYANYLDAIHLSDEYVGQLLDRLERDGLAKNTIVVISSDHGPLFRGKQFLYDGGIHVPLMVRFPDGCADGTVKDDLVSGIDIAPILLGFAGIRPRAGAMQGQDVFGPSYVPRTHVFVARDRMNISIDRMRTVRTGQYKYIRRYFPAFPYMQHNPYKEHAYPTWNLVKELYKEGKLNPVQSLFVSSVKPMEELFDIHADPDKVRNLADDRAHKMTLAYLRSLVDWLRQRERQTGDAGRSVDIYRGYYGHLPEEPGA
jgi:N-sulfoglucosamine sulfohydrolase